MNDEIQRAIDTGAIIEIAYTNSDGTASVRRLSNISYSAQRGNGYIEAFCYNRQERRTFKICRISKLTFVTSPNGTTQDPTSPSPSDNQRPYKFNGNKRIFALYGNDYNS